MSLDLVIWCMVLVPLAGGLLALSRGAVRAVMLIVCGTVLIAGVFSGAAIFRVFTHGPLSAADGWLFIDGLSAYNLVVMNLIFLLSTGFSVVYFAEEARIGTFGLKQARMFASLWCGAMAAMTLVLVSNNLGLMWVGIETTTLTTAFLICVHESRPSLEAMWKYILICSVGVAFAFMGTLLIAASAQGLDIRTTDLLLWTTLREHSVQLKPVLVKIAFIFLVVGYGAKAGLAPMHNWLPDAHSQAPSPVSALFSGFMLNAALYCIMRYLPIVEGATGGVGWGTGILSIFGLLSIVVAAAFILFQQDIKRLLAYHSVEHIGIIALGLGTGGLGTFAALFHTLNHSVCKALSFLAAGRLGQIFGSHDMKKLSGALAISPVWGWGLFAGILALVGLAPFSLFISEFLLVKALVDKSAWAPLVIFLAGVCIVFVGALAHAIPIAWGAPEPGVRRQKATGAEIALVALPLALLAVLGVWMPVPLQHAITGAADIIRGLTPATVQGVQP